MPEEIRRYSPPRGKLDLDYWTHNSISSEGVRFAIWCDT